MSGKSLLLVDPDARSLRVLEVSLRKAGYEVRTAENADEALHLALNEPPHLLVTESELPDGDGFDLVDALRSEKSTENCAVIFLTQTSSAELKIRGLNAGIDEFLIKPVLVMEIVARIEGVLAKQQRQNMQPPEKAGNMHGSLHDMGVVDIIQIMEAGGKDGIVSLKTSSGKSRGVTRDREAAARIFFSAGDIIDAECEHAYGEEAVYRLLLWEDGHFNIEFTNHDRPVVIEAPSQAVLLEGLRRVDEWTRIAGSLPNLNSVATVIFQNIANEGEDVSNNLRTILHLFDGKRTLFEIVDDAPMADLDALEALLAIQDMDALRMGEPGTEDIEAFQNWLSQNIAAPIPKALGETVIPSKRTPSEILGRKENDQNGEPNTALISGTDQDSEASTEDLEPVTLGEPVKRGDRNQEQETPEPLDVFNEIGDDEIEEGYTPLLSLESSTPEEERSSPPEGEDDNTATEDLPSYDDDEGWDSVHTAAGMFSNLAPEPSASPEPEEAEACLSNLGEDGWQAVHTEVGIGGGPSLRSMWTSEQDPSNVVEFSQIENSSATTTATGSVGLQTLERETLAPEPTSTEKPDVEDSEEEPIPPWPGPDRSQPRPGINTLFGQTYNEAATQENSPTEIAPALSREDIERESPAEEDSPEQKPRRLRFVTGALLLLILVAVVVRFNNRSESQGAPENPPPQATMQETSPPKKQTIATTAPNQVAVPPQAKAATETPATKRPKLVAPREQTIEKNAALDAGERHLQEEAFESALKAFKEALKALPNNASVQSGLAMSFMGLEQDSSARKHALRALEIREREARSYFVLGVIEFNAGNHTAARENYEKYLAHAPNGKYASEVRMILKSL